MTRWLVCLLALPLAACNDDIGNVQLSMNDTDGNGASLSLDLPGIKGNIDLPKAKVNGADFDLNGVKLYPGSKIGKLNLGFSGAGKGDGNAVVDVTFESPATPDKVRDYFKERLPKAGFKLEDAGLGFTGKTDEGKPFAMELKPAGADRTAGTIHITG